MCYDLCVFKMLCLIRIQLLCIAAAGVLLYLLIMETVDYKAGRSLFDLKGFGMVFAVIAIYLLVSAGLFGFMVRML